MRLINKTGLLAGALTTLLILASCSDSDTSTGVTAGRDAAQEILPDDASGVHDGDATVDDPTGPPVTDPLITDFFGREKIQVHIADDHKILIEGIVAVINTEEDIEIEGFSLNGKEVIDWAENHSADILILDINMPIYDGIEVLKFFKIKKWNQKVIILSSYDDVKLVQEMINLGANGFLSKDSAGQHLVEAIRTVHEGEQYFSDTIKNNLLKLYRRKNLRPW